MLGRLERAVTDFELDDILALGDQSLRDGQHGEGRFWLNRAREPTV